jgi:hypothetical protein
MTPVDPALPYPESLPRLPRRKLGRGTLALLILLRIYVALAVPMVAYAFIKATWG